MPTSEAVRQQMREMPPPLRELLEAELSAGNQVVEIGHTFPAPPVGAWFLLERPVATRPRTSSAGVQFYERNSSQYSGEFSDDRRFYFVLEPPLPSPAEPDMDAIREAANRSTATPPVPTPDRLLSRSREAVAAQPVEPGSIVRRFRESMELDYERWHDGAGYDMGAIAAASPAEKEEIEAILLRRGVKDWRDVEALAALETPDARDELLEVLETADPELSMAVLSYAPDIASEALREAAIIRAIRTARIYGGLTGTLREVAAFHPPAVVHELFRMVLHGEDEVAVHYAAILFFLYGKAREPFDWEHRELFLRFREAAGNRRASAFRDLCRHIGLDAGLYLPPESPPLP